MKKMPCPLLAVKEGVGERVRRPHTYEGRCLGAPPGRWAARDISLTQWKPWRPRGSLLSSRVAAAGVLKVDTRRLAPVPLKGALIEDCAPATGARKSREKKKTNFCANQVCRRCGKVGGNPANRCFNFGEWGPAVGSCGRAANDASTIPLAPDVATPGSQNFWPIRVESISSGASQPGDSRKRGSSFISIYT